MAGRIVGVAAHPNADRVRIAQIDAGDVRQFQVVYGGTRVIQIGDLVPFAPPGARLPTGVKMRRRRYRGVDSFGMICSLGEFLGIPVGRDEVHVLSDDFRPGDRLDKHRKDVLDYLGYLRDTS